MNKSWRGMGILGFTLAMMIAGRAEDDADLQKAQAAQEKFLGTWYKLYYEDILGDHLEKARAGLKRQPPVVEVGEYQQAVDDLMFLVSSHASALDRKDNPARRIGTKPRREPYFPNVDIAEAHFHLGHFNQAKEFLLSPNCLEPQDKRKTDYLNRIAVEEKFIDRVESTLAEMDQFRKKGKPSATELKKRITTLLDIVSDLEAKDYDVTPWLERAQQYTSEMKATRNVLDQFKLRGAAPPPPPDKKKKGEGRAPEPAGPFRQLTAAFSPLWQLVRPWVFIGALDTNHKMFKKYEDRMKRAAEKGETEEALEDLTDALDFLDGAGADAAEPKRVELEQRIAALKRKVGGETATDPLADLLASIAQVRAEVEGLTASKKSPDLRKAQDLLIGANNKIKAALEGITDPARSAVVLKEQDSLSPFLKKVGEEIDQRILDLMRSVKAATDPVDQIKSLKEVETLNPDHLEMKALLPKAYSRVDEEVNRLYKLGMNAYAEEKIEEAISIWGKARDLRVSAKMQEHKRLNSDLAKAEQQYEKIFGKKPPKASGG